MYVCVVGQSNSLKLGQEARNMYFIIKTLSTYGIDTGITWKERSMTQHHHPPIYLIFLSQISTY